MAVYVDPPFWSYGRMKMCHMVADSLEELHAMAEKLGLRKWFQCPPKTKYPHYDISKSKRSEAVRHGAIEVGMKEIIPYAEELRKEFLAQ